jgi:YVTN family beta-propeller protein
MPRLPRLLSASPKSAVYPALIVMACLALWPAGATPVDPTAADLAAAHRTDLAADAASAVEIHLALPGQTYRDLFPESLPERTSQDVDPGVPPEGDYLGWTAFTPDGGRLLLTNRGTNNVTVFDWATMAVLATVDVGTYPAGIAATEDYAVVACAFSDEVHIIDLADYSVVAVIPTGEQPWVVRISPDGARAYVSCDIDDVCEVIDLATLSHVRTITGFPIQLLTWAYNSENGRNYVEFTDFEVTPSGQHLMVGDRGQSVLFFNTQTGAVDFTVNGVTDCVKLSLSGDGTKAVATNVQNPTHVYQIDLASHAVTGTVALSGLSLSMTYDAAVNQDGSRAFVAVSGNQSAIVRFPTSNYVLIPSTYTPYWIDVSPDHQYAVGGQFRFSIVSFASEIVVGQHQGNAQCYGSVAPVGRRAGGYDPCRHEGIYFYDFTTPSAVLYRGTTNAGVEPEGDCPRRIAITPDGTKAVATNVLSDNAAIINLQSYAVEAVLPMGDRVQDVAITPDGHWAVACCFNGNSVKVIDLANNTVAAEVYAGTGAGVVSLNPDGTRAYVGNIVANTVSVIALAGAASYKVADVPCGEIGVSWAAYGVSSDVEVSPTGAYVLVAVSFDDNVKVIDTTTNTVVATLATGDFPLQIAFDASGDYATVTNYLANTYTVMRIAGAASSVVGTFASAGDQYPLRLACRPDTDQIGIGFMGSKRLVMINPHTGAIQATQSFAAYGSLISVAFDAIDGQPVVLTQSTSSASGHLHGRGDVMALPAVPADMNYVGPAAIVPLGGEGGRDGDRVAGVAMPGPDWVTFVRWDTSGLPEIMTVPLSAPALIMAPRPQPLRGEGHVEFSLARAGEVRLDLIDVSGRQVAPVASGSFPAGRHEVGIAATGMPAGVYQLVLRSSGHVLASRRVHVAGGD